MHTGHSKHPLPTTRDDSTHEHHQMINTEIRLIIFFAAEALYRLDEAQSGNKISGRNINNIRYAADTTLMEESKEVPGVTGKFVLGVQNEAGQRLTEFCQENNTKDDSAHGHHQMVSIEIRLIIFFVAKDGEATYSQQK